jgi:hypothetical protein
MKPLYTLIILALLTLTGFGQEPTLPAKREITDTAGRKIAGEIVSKTDTAIKFRRESDGKEFEIALDKLSAADRTFIAGSANSGTAKPPAANSKNSVLLIAQLESNADTVKKYSTYEETIKWLESKGLEVTLGLLPDPDYKTEHLLEIFGMPAEQKNVILTDLNALDQFHIVWIKSFPHHGRYAPKHIAITKHREKRAAPLVVRCREELARKDHYNEDYKGTKTKSNERENYVKVKDTWVFYDDEDTASKNETRDQLLEKLNKLLGK